MTLMTFSRPGTDMAAIAILIFLAALAGCAWGAWVSLKLVFRSLNRIFTPESTFQGAVALSKADESVTRPRVPPDIPPWVQATISDHIATCETCRTSYVEGTLPLLQPETVTRIVALVEAHDAPRVKPL